MFDTHEQILLKLAETGLKEFSPEMVKEAMYKVEDEEIDRMYELWRRETTPTPTETQSRSLGKMRSRI